MKGKAPGKLKENEEKVTKQWRGQSTERAGGSFDICEDLHRGVCLGGALGCGKAGTAGCLVFFLTSLRQVLGAAGLADRQNDSPKSAPPTSTSFLSGQTMHCEGEKAFEEESYE